MMVLPGWRLFLLDSMVTIFLRHPQPLPKENNQRIRITACYEREVNVI